MSITLYTGRPGTGKTYLLTRQVLQLLNDGYVVYCNYWIDWHGVKGKKWNWWKFRNEEYEYPASNLRSWSDIAELYNTKNCIIVMDEANVYMDAREWASMPRQFKYKLSQHRHDAIHIFGTVQSINRVDVIFRELVDFWYVLENHFFWVTRWEFNIDDDKMKKFPMSKKHFLLRKKFYSRYDTLQKIAFRE